MVRRDNRRPRTEAVRIQMVDRRPSIWYLSSVSPTSVARLAAAVLTAALLAGCSDDDSSATQPSQQEAPVDGAVGDGDDSTRAATEPAAGASSGSDTAFDPSFLYRRAPRLLPHDYEIGLLQDLLVTGRTEREALGTLVSFLTALAEGTIAEAAITADRRQSLSRSLQFHLGDGRLPRAARIGALVVADDRIHLSVRLFGEPGRVAGEAYLEATPDGWRIADLQLDLQRLGQPYVAQAEFAPSISRWLLPAP